MDSDGPSAIASSGTGISLQDLVRGERARALRAQLASWHPERSPEEIEDAIQTACKRFLERAEMRGPAEVYVWIRTTAHRALNCEAARHARELAVDPVEHRVASIAAEEPGPAEELISKEEDADLAKLVDEVYASLPQRGRAVLALHGTGCKRPEIAERLGLSERIVKRELEEIMEKARAAVARLSGGGCQRGEQVVLRFVCGLAAGAEEAQARDHLAHCGRCEVFCERLIAWREKAGAMLPAPVAEGASPGVLERVAQKTADGLGSVKQQILEGGAQLKQQATATYYRAVDPTPLAAARRRSAWHGRHGRRWLHRSRRQRHLLRRGGREPDRRRERHDRRGLREGTRLLAAAARSGSRRPRLHPRRNAAAERRAASSRRNHSAGGRETRKGGALTAAAA